MSAVEDSEIVAFHCFTKMAVTLFLLVIKTPVFVHSLRISILFRITRHPWVYFNFWIFGEFSKLVINFANFFFTGFVVENNWGKCLLKEKLSLCFIPIRWRIVVFTFMNVSMCYVKLFLSTSRRQWQTRNARIVRERDETINEALSWEKCNQSYTEIVGFWMGKGGRLVKTEQQGVRARASLASSIQILHRVAVVET